MVRYHRVDLPTVVSAFLQVCPPGAIILLRGDLGAGKTTFVAQAAYLLGVAGPVTSPTYAYHSQYAGKALRVHHFDLYRLESEDDFFEHGFHTVFSEKESIVFVEWPDVILSFLERSGYAARVMSCQLDCFDANPDVRVLRYSDSLVIE